MTVYFLRRNGDPKGLVKIGFTADLDTRLVSLRTGSPEGLEVICTVPGGRDLEAYLHAAFEDDGAGGEWFHPSSSLDRMIDILSRQGLGALPAGLVGDEDPEQDPELSDMGDVLLASRMIKRAALPLEPGESIKAQILRASRRLRWSYTRVKDIWYGGARRISAWEMRKLYAATNEQWATSDEQRELEELKRRVKELEGDRAFTRALDRTGTGG